MTLDTGALIAIERRDRRMTARHAAWVRDDVRVTVPTFMIAEWWRGQRGSVAHVLDAFTIEPPSRALAETAGVALAQLRLGKGAHDQRDRMRVRGKPR